MPEIRKRYDREFREGAVRIVEETGKPIAQVARDLGVNGGTLGNWWLGPGRPARAPRAAQGLDRGAMRNGAKSAVWSLSVTLQRLGNRWSAGMRPETRVSPKAGVAGWNPAGGTTPDHDAEAVDVKRGDQVFSALPRRRRRCGRPLIGPCTAERAALLRVLSR
jgi:hypothetical protein